MRFRRVVVALGASSSTVALATAVGLARTMDAELVGLFVEDSDLIEFAALPFAGEIGFPSATRRPLDVSAMERSLRAQARRFRQEVSERLAGQPVKWSFEVVRGRTVAAIASAVAERDLVVISARTSAVSARCEIAHAFESLSVPLLLVSELPRHHRMIAVIAPLDAPADDIADVVVALATHYGRSALFVIVDAERSQWVSWQRGIAALLAERDVTARFRVVASASRSELDCIVAEERPRLIVALAPVRKSRDALLDTLPYPLLVLPQTVARA